MTISTQPVRLLSALLEDENLATPAFVYDEAAIMEKLTGLSSIRDHGCHILYSIKALSISALLASITKHVDGFSSSSLFESRLAREFLGDTGSIHTTSPGLKHGDMKELVKYTDYISFNSFSQWEQCRHFAGNVRCGLRINPGLSFVRDERYDPCRRYSKLGIPLPQLVKNFPVKGITGIHIHNNCQSEYPDELRQSIDAVCNTLNNSLEQLEWLNLGGGYFFDNASQIDEMCDIIIGLKQRFGIEIFYEPGKGVVGKAGYLVATVIDLFESDGMYVAVLDTSINHLPEVFEYQYQPAILHTSEEGEYLYQLAGASCLSGDLFGNYCFNNELKIGSRVIFPDVGAYMLVKATMFNGINLPGIYSLTSAGKLVLQKIFEYSDYRSRW